MFLQVHDMTCVLQETQEQLKAATTECAKLSAENTKLKNENKVALCVYMYTVKYLSTSIICKCSCIYY